MMMSTRPRPFLHRMRQPQCVVTVYWKMMNIVMMEIQWLVTAVRVNVVSKTVGVVKRLVQPVRKILLSKISVGMALSQKKKSVTTAMPTGMMAVPQCVP